MTFWKVVAVIVFAICIPQDGAASFRVCNPASVSQSVSIAHKSADGWVSEGWWNIGPGECTTILKEALKQRYYYYRATSEGTQFEGTGHRFCTSTSAYTIEGAEDCVSRGFQSSEFAEVDTGVSAQSYELALKILAPSGKSQDRATAENGAPDDALSRSGSVGEPYTVSAIFQGCRPFDGAEACAFHAEGAKWYAWYGAETPVDVMAGLEGLNTGQLMDVTGDLISFNDISVDAAVWSFEPRGPRNEYENTLSGIQGIWKNRDDPKEILEIFGGEALVFYDKEQVEHSYIQVGDFCEDLSDMGLVLVRRDPASREDFCYAILGWDAQTLHLAYMQGTGGSEFFYLRQ